MDYIIITGMGRSGTSFLARLLKDIREAEVKHEFIGNREYWLLSWYLNGDAYAIPYLEREKRKIERDFSKSYFIDVNGYLQVSAPYLKKVFNTKAIFHLVRDPRLVIRSIYTRRNDNSIHFIPKNRHEIEKWIDSDKFYQICWNWASTTDKLLSEDTILIQFERLINDFSYFKENLLKPFGFNIPFQTWESYKSKQINKTRSNIYRYLYSKIKGKEYIKDNLPRYELWSTEQKKIFKDICGKTMEKIGYKI